MHIDTLVIDQIYTRALDHTFSFTANSAGNYLFVAGNVTAADNYSMPITPSSNMTTIFENSDVLLSISYSLKVATATLETGETASIRVENSKTGSDAANRKFAFTMIFKY